MENWNEFCSYLIDCRERNVSEDRYHEIIESQLSLFGWSRFKGEIIHKERIPSGHGFAEPDILLKKDGINQVVIEVKKPCHIQHKDDRVQLLSYMRLCTLRVGVYIGEHIEVFYDQQTKNEEPTSVFKVDIKLNNEDGKQFVELFSKNSFSKDELIQFCEVQIIEQQKQKTLNLIKDELVNGKYSPFIADCIKRHLMTRVDSKFTEEQITTMLSTLTFKAVYRDAQEVAGITNTIPLETTTPQKDTNNSSTKQDNTLYSLDGGALQRKNRFVLTVVRKYVQQNPQKTFAELEQIFPQKWQGSFGVIRTLDYIKQKNFQGKRYFMEPGEVMKSADGILFAVTTQWNFETVQRIVDFANSQGWNVSNSKQEARPEIPQSNEEDIVVFIKRNCDAKGIFNIKKRTVTVLRNSIINSGITEAFAKNKAGVNKRQKLLEQYTQEINGKRIVVSDILFDSPSGASLFCIGGSSDGWREWRDEDNKPIEKYKQLQ